MDVKEKAPEFTLLDENGKNVSLRDYRGRNVVVYFFPKAFTPGCSAEAREFAENIDKFKAAGATVIVLGTDVDTHRLALARDLGAHHVLNVQREDAAALVDNGLDVRIRDAQSIRQFSN